METKSKRRINLDELVYKLKFDLPLSEDDLIVEASIPKPYSSKYQEPREHLKNFANAYIVETSLKILFDLEFNDIDYHMYLIEGHGSGKADLHVDDTQIEVKYFKKEDKFNNWLNGDGFYLNHSADFLLVYCLDTNKIYVLDMHNKTYREAKKQFEKKLDLF